MPVHLWIHCLSGSTPSLSLSMQKQQKVLQKVLLIICSKCHTVHSSMPLMKMKQCYGQLRTKDTVHLAAPGSGITSTVLENNYASYSGTSMASPASLLLFSDPP